VYDADPNAKDKGKETPLDLATDKSVDEHHTKMVELLIKHRARITETIKKDQTGRRHRFTAIRERLP
jgi:ankyrin repeat protein